MEYRVLGPLEVVESAAGRYLGDQSSDQESRGDLATLDTLARDLRARGFATEAHLGYGDVKCLNPGGKIAPPGKVDGIR